MARLTNNAEGGTNGTTVTTGNSGGLSGNAFDAVAIGTSPDATLTFSTEQFRGVALGYKHTTPATGKACNLGWTTSLGGSFTTVYGRVYVYMAANPGAVAPIAITRNASVATATRIDINTNGTLRLVSSASSNEANSTAAVPLSRWFRIEYKAVHNATTGSLEVRLYSTADSTVITETVSYSGKNTLAECSEVRFGNTAAVANLTYFTDNIGIDTTDWLGPAPTMGGLFYLTAAASDLGNTDVRELSVDHPTAQNETTILDFGTTTGSGNIVADPLTTRSTRETITNPKGYGWGISQALMGSTATVRRAVETGGWTVHVYAKASVLQTGTPTTFTVFLNRVSASDVLTQIATGTLSGQALGVTYAGYGVAMNGVSSVLLEAGESFEVEVWVTSVGVAVVGQQITVSLGPTATGLGTSYSDVSLPGFGVRNNFPASTSDTTSLSDSLARIAIFPRGPADTTSLSDAVARAFTGARSLADTAPATDAVARTAIFPRGLDDTIPTASDTVARVATFPRGPADSAPATDAVVRAFTGSRSIADSAPATDGVTRSGIFNRTIEDDLTSGAVVSEAPDVIFDRGRLRVKHSDPDWYG